MSQYKELLNTEIRTLLKEINAPISLEQNIVDTLINTGRTGIFKNQIINALRIGRSLKEGNQNMAFIDHPEYGNYLFIPFKDRTNTITTYGSGRYIDIDIPEESIVIIDFNEAYNPYCAYYDRWSCPLVPFENHLDIHIYAGEKKYK